MLGCSEASIPVSIPWRLGAFAIPDSTWTPPLSAESLGQKPGRLGLGYSPKGAGVGGGQRCKNDDPLKIITL